MLIVCPNCQTYYTVDRRGFEPDGRTVRCHNCGNSWRQGLVPENSVPPAMAAPPQPAPAPQGYPPQGYAPYPPQGYAPYPPQPYPEQQAAPQPAAPEPAPAPPPPPPPPPPEDDEVVEPDFDLPDPEEDDDDLDDAMAANIDELFGEDDGDDDVPAPALDDDEDEEVATGGAADDDLSDEDIDGLFDDEEATGISSMIESSPDSDDDNEGFDDFEDIPDPEPLPESLTGALDDDDDEEDDIPAGRVPRRKIPKKKGKGGLIAFIIILLLLIGVGVAGYFFRALVVEIVPEAKVVYDTVGLDTGVLGDGLEIRNVESSRATEGGIDILIVSGSVVNVVDVPAPVPLIQVVLLDADGVELQAIPQEPSQHELQPGQSIEFSIRIDEPSPLSRRMEVTFAPRGDGGH